MAARFAFTALTTLTACAAFTSTALSSMNTPISILSCGQQFCVLHYPIGEDGQYLLVPREAEILSTTSTSAPRQTPNGTRSRSRLRRPDLSVPRNWPARETN